MSNSCKIIKIEDIENNPNKVLQIEFEDYIDGINSNAPIKASLVAVPLGDFIEITGNVQGSALLECDLCLSEFEHKLNFDVEELFAKDALQEEYERETELKEGQFVTDLKGSKDINITDLLYQSVILDFPNKKVCGINCKGNNFLSEDDFTQNAVDPRLAVFKDIKIETEK